jgi:hypothetical protein
MPTDPAVMNAAFGEAHLYLSCYFIEAASLAVARALHVLRVTIAEFDPTF